MRSRIVLDELLTEWRRGGEYPYDTSFPKLHRAWSVATGLVWEMGFRASRVQFEMCGNVNLLAQPVVGVLWHRWCAVAIDLMRHPAFSARPQIWLNLRENKMGPTHVICKRFGVDLALTSNREQSLGKEAVELIARLLRDGSHSTIVMPDGPSGVPFKIRKGALMMALVSGRPILPLKVESTGLLVMEKQWDKKRIPLPGGRVKITVGNPIYVASADDFEETKARIRNQLD